jgi:dGTPase
MVPAHTLSFAILAMYCYFKALLGLCKGERILPVQLVADVLQDMNIREAFEERERSFMSPFGCLSSESKGRLRAEPECPIRTAFQKDRDRILYSTAFRRLKHKTQVFLSPMGDQYRTRLTHTLEVAQIARTIARAMRLNEDLAEAIALGHDLGHTPFGHGGETVLKEIYSEGFSHPGQSLRVVDRLEKNGEGLNLTLEVRDGILKHSKGYGNIIPEDPSEKAITYEGQVVRIADIMAYLNHDLDDAVRSKVISPEQIPAECVAILGKTHSERATTMIHDLIFNTRVVGSELCLNMSEAVFSAMTRLRQFLYHHVYRAPKVHNEFVKAKKILSEIFAFYLVNEDELKRELSRMEILDRRDQGQKTERLVCDMIASMTDRYALDLYTRLFFPKPMV